MKNYMKAQLLSGLVLSLFLLLSYNGFSQTTISCPDGDLYTCYVNGPITVYKGIGKVTVIIQ